MKYLVNWLVLPCFLFFASTASASNEQKAIEKTRAHHCAVYKKNAQKSKARYDSSKKQLDVLEVKLKVLGEEQKRMPSSTRMANLVVTKKMQTLRKEHRQSLKESKTNLANHIEYTKAVMRACAQIGRAN